MFLLTFLISCESPTNRVDPLSVKDSSKQMGSNKVDTSSYANEDLIVIVSENYDSLVYTREEFDDIVEHFPILYTDIPQNPHISYYRSGMFKEIVDKNGKEKTISFVSETGQDTYFILYAYFLKKKNTNKDLIIRRNTLIKYIMTSMKFSAL